MASKAPCSRKYPDTGSPLASGFLHGEKLFRARPPRSTSNSATGHVVLLGFRPQWRGQPFGTFRVIFNAAVYVK